MFKGQEAFIDPLITMAEEAQIITHLHLIIPCFKNSLSWAWKQIWFTLKSLDQMQMQTWTHNYQITDKWMLSLTLPLLTQILELGALGSFFISLGKAASCVTSYVRLFCMERLLLVQHEPLVQKHDDWSKKFLWYPHWLI